MSRTPPKRTPRERPVEPITAPSLRELFGQHVIRGRLKMPGDAELAELARILEWWRLNFENQLILDLRSKLQIDASAALQTLREAVSKISKLDTSNFTAAVSDSAPAGMLRYLSERAGESSGVHALIEQIERHPGLTYTPSGLGATSWRWLAGVLPQDFINAMKSENPDFNPGIGHTGPVARFIAAVVPIVTGEHPSVGSVSTQLKAHRKLVETGEGEKQ